MHPAISTIQIEPLLTEVQAADLLRLSIRTLQAWRARRFGPRFVRAGRAIRYRRIDIVEWVEAQTVPASAQLTKAFGQ